MATKVLADHVQRRYLASRLGKLDAVLIALALGVYIDGFFSITVPGRDQNTVEISAYYAFCNPFKPQVESGIQNPANNGDSVYPPFPRSSGLEFKYELDSLAAFLELS